MQGALLAYNLIGPVYLVEACTAVGFRWRRLLRLVADSRGERLGHGAAAVCGGSSWQWTQLLDCKSSIIVPVIALVLG